MGPRVIVREGDLDVDGVPDGVKLGDGVMDGVRDIGDMDALGEIVVLADWEMETVDETVTDAVFVGDTDADEVYEPDMEGEVLGDGINEVDGLKDGVTLGVGVAQRPIGSTAAICMGARATLRNNVPAGACAITVATSWVTVL